MTNPTPEQEQEAMRREFEAWAMSKGFELAFDEFGDYVDQDTFCAWGSWQAASAQLSALRKSHAELLEAAAGWWEERRPVHYSQGDHASNATVNCVTDAEDRLANLIAKELQA